MSTPTTKPSEEKRALAVVELAKTFLPAAIAAQGPLPSNAGKDEVAAYFDRTCNIAISLAGLFRKKSIELVESAKAMDAKAEATPNGN